MGKESACNAGAAGSLSSVRSLGWEDPLEKGMTTRFSVFAWRTPWTEESGGLWSMGPRLQLDTTEAQYGTVPKPRSVYTYTRFSVFMTAYI